MERSLNIAGSGNNQIESNVKSRLLDCCASLAKRVSLKRSATVEVVGLSEKAEGGTLLMSSGQNALAQTTCVEKKIMLFSSLSSICSITNVRPDLWFRTEGDVPVLLAEVVSTVGGEAASFRQTLLKIASNTVDMLRLYMSLRDSIISELSSIVLPKYGNVKTSAAIVTAKFCPNKCLN